MTAILEAVARAANPPTMSDIAREIGAPVSSVHDLVSGLTAQGWLNLSDRRLTLGSAPRVLGLMAHAEDDARTHQIDLDLISQRYGLSAAVAIRVGHRVVYTRRSKDTIDVRLAALADAFVPRSPLTTASGRLLLACGPETARADLLRAMQVRAPRLVERYSRAVPMIRRTRMAWSDGLSRPDIAAVAVLVDPEPSDVSVTAFGDRVKDRQALREAAADLQRTYSSTDVASRRHP